MSVNSIGAADSNYEINKNKSNIAKSASSVTSSSTSEAENSLQTLDIPDEIASVLGDTGKDKAKLLAEQYQIKVAQLQAELQNIRTEKQRLISQMASMEADDENRNKIPSELSKLNSQSNSIYMQMISALQEYDSSLKELLADGVRKKVEESLSVQNTLSQAAPIASSNVAAQTSMEGYNAQKGQALASAARNVRGTTGWCLAGVNDQLEKVFGQRLSYNGACDTVSALQGNVPEYQNLASNFKEVSVSRDELTSLPAGAIVVWEASSGHQYGHISIALGDGQESSDFIGSQMTAREANYHVFIPV